MRPAKQEKAAHAEVLGHRQRRKHIVELRHEGDAGPHAPVGADGCHNLAAEPHRACACGMT